MDMAAFFVIPKRRKKESNLSIEYKEYLADWITKLEKKAKYMERKNHMLTDDGVKELNSVIANLRVLKTCSKTFSSMEKEYRGKA
jgi:hypothetical protein